MGWVSGNKLAIYFSDKGTNSNRRIRGLQNKKDWTLFDMGTIDLVQEKGTLTLQALEITGDMVLDSRMLARTRKEMIATKTGDKKLGFSTRPYHHGAYGSWK